MSKYRKTAAVILVFLMICSCEMGLAGVYTLPSSVTVLDEEAFAGDLSLTEIILQSGVTSIGNECFRECKNLYRIAIPQTVSSIGTDCFTGCLRDFLIQTQPGSYAMTWAVDHHVDFQANTHYRAFLIGQTYDHEEKKRLSGTMNDVESLSKCLSNAAGTAYTIKVGHDLTASEILDGIDSVFGEAQDQDVSLFYYAGHGHHAPGTSNNGALCGVGETYVTPSELRQKLDQIRGRKIIILDSCYSGAFIPSQNGAKDRSQNAQTKDLALDFVNSFIFAFSTKSRGINDFNRYYILAAAAEDESSYETLIGSQTAGLFTSYLAKGLGYNVWNHSFIDRLADTNLSGAVSLCEAYQFLKTYLSDGFQTVQVFPSDCDWISIVRER